MPAEQMRHELLAVADSEHRGWLRENGRIDCRAAGRVNAVGAAGDDHAFAALEFGGGRFTGANLGEYTEIANLAGDQMTILSARIKYGDLGLIQLLRFYFTPSR